MPKKNGQYMVPEVAFETLVEWTKWKSIKDKRSADRWRIQDTWDSYVREYKTMRKMLTRVSLFDIIAITRRTPKFNLDYNDSWYRCFDASGATELLSGTSGGSTSNSTTIINNPTTIINNASYQLAVKTGEGAGHPVNEATSYQNNLLINATDIEFVILAKQVLSKIDGDFTHNAVNGTIALTALIFYTGDSLIIPYNKTT